MCNEEGIYVSNYCQQNGLDQCALMITSFPGKQFIIILLLKLEPVKYIDEIFYHFYNYLIFKFYHF